MRTRSLVPFRELSLDPDLFFVREGKMLEKLVESLRYVTLGDMVSCRDSGVSLWCRLCTLAACVERIEHMEV